MSGYQNGGTIPMETTMTMNEWFAEQCGVEDILSGTYGADHYTVNGRYINGTWDIKDPRCMQVVRERFSIATSHGINGWLAMSYHTNSIVGHTMYPTIIQAEYACCVAIYEASK